MPFKFKFKAEDLISKGRTSAENVDAIKSWLQTIEDEFVPKNLPDEMIVLFLLCCENRPELTKQTITWNFKLKRQCPELHDNRIVTKDTELMFDIWSIVSSPKRTPENYVIHYLRLNDADCKKFDLTEIFRATLMLMDVSLRRTADPPDGLVVVMDFGLAGLRHLTKMNLDLMRHYFNYLQEALPMKMRAIHYLNSNFALKKVFSLIKFLIKNDLFDTMTFHPPGVSDEYFYEFIPKDCLPKDYGGDMPSLNDLTKLTRQQFIDCEEYWKTEENLRKNIE
ncbi:unnamed protein product [Phyllotreta striolata]|uniref:CRAL-TRIO domain-containing protein n=1 Tax=Phyllotreta striolata TaxID=444603 RepID=A0A9N9TQX3_PHYSR|nr:unnamed protein product [Phyllotreta striolata]